MASDQMHGQRRVSKLGVHVEAVGVGLFAAGMLLAATLYLGAYLRAGFDGLIDAVDPLLLVNYLPLLALIPGFVLIWAGRKMSNG